MANDIRYICLSDLHLGEEDSLLTNLMASSAQVDPSQPSPVMIKLIECMKYLIENANQGKKPTLVLCGDILELALTTTDQAAMVFERFIELAMKPDEELFEAIIYIPGNHDHHFWESARETQYVGYIESIKAGDPFDPPYHATSMFADKLSDRPNSYFLTRLTQRQPHLSKRKFNIYVAYPNLGIVDKKGQKCVILYHGHFIDSLYHLMSTIKTLIFPGRKMPKLTWDIEAENFAWIDFFWSTMGRSGEVGRDVELIYEKMQDRDQFKKVLSRLVKNLEEKYDLPGWDFMTAKLLTKILHAVTDKAMKTERGLKKEPLSLEGEKGLRAHVQGPLLEQIRTERNGKIPPEVTLVFGHTHKPFQRDMIFRGYQQWVNVYNTGGWVVDTMEAEPLHGASIVLVDEGLNATSIQMYFQRGNPDDYTVRIEEAMHYTEQANPFHKKIQKLVRPSEDPWKSFSKTAAHEVNTRAQHLKARILSD